MTNIDEAKERQRLAELYAGMEEGELQEVAEDAASLTPVAHEALRSEMLKRAMEARAERKEANETHREAMQQPAPVVVARYRDLPEALIARSMLDSAGIESFLSDENLVSMQWLLSSVVGGVKLLVRDEDAETATKLLHRDIPEKIEVEGVGKYEQPRCPRCGSLDVGFDEVDKAAAHAAIALVGLPVALVRKGGKCHACEYEWDWERETRSD